MKIAVYGLKATGDQRKLFEDFFELIDSKHIEILIFSELKEILIDELQLGICDYPTFSGYFDLPDNLDFIFTFGGDGTILSAATIIQNKEIPVVGVNTGRLGFLATINSESLFGILDDVLSGNYIISSRSLIGIHSDEIELEFPFALNEISVTRRETTSMITVEAWVNGEALNSYWGDGLIISTPTGSTGYSLSCGGPIVHPKNEVFIVTAIAPHNLNIRPYIISDDSVLDLKINTREGEYFLSLDSRNKPLPSNVKLHLKKAGFRIKIVIPKDMTYLMTLRDKMFWGSDKRN